MKQMQAQSLTKTRIHFEMASFVEDSLFQEITETVIPNADSLGKCFTYVTKTNANLTTYSTKPENYNVTIIFEIDNMKN